MQDFKNLCIIIIIIQTKKVSSGFDLEWTCNGSYEDVG